MGRILEALERIGASMLASHEDIADKRQEAVGRAACFALFKSPETQITDLLQRQREQQ